MIEQFMQYLKDFRDGKVAFEQFNPEMEKLLHLVDEVNSVLDGTMMRSLADQGAQARSWVGEMVAEYEVCPELFEPTYAER